MYSFPRWKIWLILTVLVVSAMASLPNIASVPSWWPASLSKPMSLGLDLKGGIHLVLDVDVDQAVAHSVEEDVDTARQTLRREKIRYSKLAAEGLNLLIAIKDKSEVAAAETLLADALPGYDMATAESEITLTLKETVAGETRKFAVDQAIEVIRGRIDALGTTEPVIIKQGDRRILVQIPGYEDTARAKQLIGRTAQLEFACR